jgi:hypothetical protein
MGVICHHQFMWVSGSQELRDAIPQKDKPGVDFPAIVRRR